MASSFSVSCPNCSATLKIRDRNKLGKKARCPKCQKPFVLKIDEPDDDDFLSDLGEFEEDYSDDYDDYDELPPARSSKKRVTSSGRSSSRGAKSKKKTKKKSRPNNNGMIFGIIGGGIAVMLLVGLVGFLISNGEFTGKKKAASYLVYLPPNLELIIRLDLDELRKNPDVKQRLEEFENTEQAALLTGKSNIKLSDISSVTMGVNSISTMMTSRVPGQPSGVQDVLAVLKCKRDISLDEIVKSNPKLSLTSHEGKQLAVGEEGTQKVYFYVVEPKTILVGSESGVFGTISRQNSEQDHSAFHFVDWSSPFAIGFSPKKPRDYFGKASLENSPPGMPPALATLAKEFSTKAQAVGLMITLENKLNLNIALKFEDSSTPATIKTSLEELVGLGKEQLEKIKQSPLMSMNPKSGEMMKSAETALDGLQFKPDGNLLAITLSTDLPSFDEKTGSAAPSTSSLMNMLGPMMGMPGSDKTGSSRNTASQMITENRMKQIGLAMHNYHDKHTKFPDAAIKDNSGKPLLSWRVSLLPFLGQNVLYEQFHLNEPWDSPHNIALLPKMPGVFSHDKISSQPGRTLYRLIQSPGALFEKGEGRRMRDIKDGTSNTVMAVQANISHAIEWTRPDSFEPSINEAPIELLMNQDAKGVFITFLLADGSVRNLHLAIPATSNELFKKLITLDGGEIVPHFD